MLYTPPKKRSFRYIYSLFKIFDTLSENIDLKPFSIFVSKLL